MSMFHNLAGRRRMKPLTPLPTSSGQVVDPTLSQTFDQAIAGYTIYHDSNGTYDFFFGTAATSGTPITNITQLAKFFKPRNSYNLPNLSGNGEWEVYATTFSDTQAFVFTPSTLNLEAYIPTGGSLAQGGINSAEMSFIQLWQPGVAPANGQGFIAGQLIAQPTPKNGYWPAFWCYQEANSTGGPNELDFAEIPITNNAVFSTTTFNDGTGITPSSLETNTFLQSSWDGFKWHLTFDQQTQFNKYQFIWSTDGLWVYLDSQLMGAWDYTYNASNPAEIMLNLAVASTSWGQPMTPTSTADFPYIFALQRLTIWTAPPSYPGFFVATNGSDSNPGTFAQPFATIGRAQTAMQGSSTKTTYIRAGTYNVTATLTLTASDNGETWSYYPPDGVNTAIFNGGSTSSTTGAPAVFSIIGGSNITINGLSIENVRFDGIQVHGGASFTGNVSNFIATGTASGNKITNCTITNTFNANGFNAGGIHAEGSTPNLTVTNNYVSNCVGMGMRFGCPNGGSDSISNLLVENNFVYNVNTAQSDSGAIYVIDLGGASTGMIVSNNYIRNWQLPGGQGRGIYLDNDCSNTIVKGNIIGPPGSANPGCSSMFNDGGSNNQWINNIIDLGTTGACILHSTANIGGTPSGVTVEGNIVIAGFTGNQTTNEFAATGFTYFQNGTYGITIKNNIYHNYQGGNLVTTGNVTGDSAPINADPLLSGWLYTIASNSPALASPISFPAIIGGWGPPGFVIPQIGTAPSCPLSTRLWAFIVNEGGNGAGWTDLNSGWALQPMDGLHTQTDETDSGWFGDSVTWTPTPKTFMMSNQFVNPGTLDHAGMAAGTYNATWLSWLKQGSRQSMPIKIVRIWQECNASFGFPWQSFSSPAQFISAFQNMATQVRAAYPNALIDWNLNYNVSSSFGNGSTTSYDLYPGDAFVDIISFDGYEKTTTFANLQTGSGVNLTNLASFAQAHGKKVGIGETAAHGCDGTWITDLANWLDSLGSTAAYFSYYDQGLSNNGDNIIYAATGQTGATSDSCAASTLQAACNSCSFGQKPYQGTL